MQCYYIYPWTLSELRIITSLFKFRSEKRVFKLNHWRLALETCGLGALFFYGMDKVYNRYIHRFLLAQPILCGSSCSFKSALLLALSVPWVDLPRLSSFFHSFTELRIQELHLGATICYNKEQAKTLAFETELRCPRLTQPPSATVLLFRPLSNSSWRSR